MALAEQRVNLIAAVPSHKKLQIRTVRDIATALGDGATPRMVSDALRRLVAAGKAARTGPRNTPLYTAYTAAPRSP